MSTAFLAIVASQVLIAALLFGTASLERADVSGWFARHPIVARHRAPGASARTLRRRQRELERLGLATQRAAERAA